MIRIFIAYTERFESCCGVLANSISRNTKQQTELHFVSPQTLNVPEAGCTGFTNLRYLVPQYFDYEGYAIYLDPDMLVLGDIEGLWNHRWPGKWVCMKDGLTEVSVIDCAAFPDLTKESVGNKRKWHIEPTIESRKKCFIPERWNVKDRVKDDIKLLHFTNLDTQPWFYPNHPDIEAVKLWKQYGGEVHKAYDI